jgi:fumarate reductase iron-sulfur subunit
MSAERVVKVECFRFDPTVDAAPHWQTFDVPLDGRMSVHDCLIYIREKLDPSLAYFINCKRGVCGRCTMRINGKPQLACVTEVTGDVQVGPVRTEGVIRDLWIDSL